MTLRAKIAPHIVETIRELRDAGFEAYIVGGAVRDFMLNRQPKDYDLSCSATPEEVKRIFRHRRAIIIGKRFRLVHLYHNREIVEISTFRRQPSQHAQAKRPPRAAMAPENMIFHDNEFGSAEEDAWRRDFTVNAIFYDPVGDKSADFTGQGVEDLRSGLVRSIGDPYLRFEEDPVRMLRALKLVGQYGFSLEAETEKALTSSMDLITHASNSRMTLEMEKILKNPYGDRILLAFRRYGFLKRFLPYLDANWDTPQGQYMLKLLEIRNARILSGEYRDSISLAMALTALPFAESLFGAQSQGELWPYFPGIESEMKSLICSALHPRIPTRRAVAAAIRTLLLQPRIKSASKGGGKVVHHPGYPHARELAMIQNEACWKTPGFAELWPKPPPYAPNEHRRHGRDRRRSHPRPHDRRGQTFDASLIEGDPMLE